MTPALVTAAVGGAVSLLLWLLNRVPALSEEGRLAAQVERDQRIVEKLSEGVAKDRLVASIETRVVRMLVLRGEGTPVERASREMRRATRRMRSVLWVSMCAAVCSVVGGVGMTIFAARDGGDSASTAFGVLFAAMGALFVFMFWNGIQELRADEEDEW